MTLCCTGDALQVSLMGCLPVTVTDGVLQPFEPEMNWADFSMDVMEQDIPNLHLLLGGLQKPQLQEFQVWDVPHIQLKSSSYDISTN